MQNFTLTSSRLVLVAALALGLGAAQPAAAQTGSPTGPAGPAPTNPTSPTTVPIDGGAGLLLAGGVAYGLRRLRQHRQR